MFPLRLIPKLCLAVLLLVIIGPLGAQDDVWPLITFENFEDVQPLVTIPLTQNINTRDVNHGYWWYERGIQFISNHELLMVVEDRIEIWDVTEQKLIRTLRPDVGTLCKTCIAWDGPTRLAIGGESGQIRFWDLETNSWDERIIDTGAELWSLAINSEQSYMLTAYADGAVKVREFPSGHEVNEMWFVFGGFVRDLKFIDNTTFVAANYWNGAFICQVDDTRDDCVYLYRDKDDNPGDYGIDNVAISPSQRLIAWRKAEVYAELWDWEAEEDLPIAGGEVRWDAPPSPSAMYSTMLFSPDETLLVTAAGVIRQTHDSGLVAWSTQTYDYVEAITFFKDKDLDIAFNPDGRSIAVLYEDKIELWGIPVGP